MSLVYADRTRETTTTTGTGTYTLAGAATGFQSFSTVGNGNTCYYTATDGTDWEVGLGTWSTGGALARTSILASSNSNNAVSWAAGSKDVFLTAPATVFGALYANPITTRGDLVTGGVAGVAQRLAVGGAGQILSSDGTDPGYVAPWASVNNGRLTLTSGLSVTTADVTGATSVYFTPHNGDQIGLYDGTRWKVYTFTERTLALGTLTSELPYDVFIYDNAGTLTLEALAWTNGTTRATALVRQDGVWCKTGVLTRRYVGTFRTTSTTTTEDSAAKRFVWNMYNRAPRAMRRKDTGLWTYTTATWRQANANTSNQLAFIRGLDEDAVSASLNVSSSNASATINRAVTITKDAVNTGPDTESNSAQSQNAASSVLGHMARWLGLPGLGYHYLAWCEWSTASGTTTWYGDSNSILCCEVKA